MEFKYSSNWTVSLLDEITDRGSGHTPNQSEPTYWNGGIKWVSLADSKRLDDLFISTTEKEISELGIKNSSAVKHPAGTVILSRDAGVGKSAILKEEMAVSQHFIVWRCSHKNILNNVYFYYWLQMMKPEFERMAVGSTIKTIGLPYFKKLRITYPPLPEQCKIAEILGAWDEAIALLEKLITAKRKLKQGLMQQLLTGKKRFKEFEGSEWLKSTIKDVAKVVTGNTPSTSVSEYYDGSFLFVSPADLGEHKYIANTEKKLSAKGFETCRKIPRGSTLFTCIGSTIGKTGMAAVNLATNQQINSIVPKSINNDFIYYSLVKIAPFIKRIASTQAIPIINKSEFEKQEILHPLNLPEQEKIASVLSAADTEISNLEKQLAAYKQQKRGLMQQLLTGKTRVRVN